MTNEREQLINKFQKWLDTNPRKEIIAAQCATIAEEYAQQQVKNCVLGDVSKRLYIEHKIWDRKFRNYIFNPDEFNNWVADNPKEAFKLCLEVATELSVC